MFDLQSLATLATARALEMGPQEGSSAASCQNFPARRILNLRRKCSWTPRNEPVRLKIPVWLLLKQDLDATLSIEEQITV